MIAKLIPIFLIAIATFLVWVVIRKRKVQLVERENLPDDIPVQDVVEAREFNGHTLYLSESDYVVWKGLSNAQKQKIHFRQLYNIKNGHLVKVTDENGQDGLITRDEAIQKGIIKA